MKEKRTCKYCGFELANDRPALARHWKDFPGCAKALDDEMLKLHKQGKSKVRISKVTHVSINTVQRRLKKLSVKAEESKISALPVEKTLGEQLLDAAFEHRDRMLLAEGKAEGLKQQVIELEAKIDSLEGYKIKYEEAIQGRARQFIQHGD